MSTGGGQVQGVASFATIDGQDLNFAIPIERAVALMEYKNRPISLADWNVQRAEASVAMIDSLMVELDRFPNGASRDAVEANIARTAKSAVAADPTNAKAWAHLARAMVPGGAGSGEADSSSYSAALRACLAMAQRATELDRDLALAWHYRGLYGLMLDDGSEQVLAHKQLTRLANVARGQTKSKADDPLVWTNLAECLWYDDSEVPKVAEKLRTDASSALDRALEIDPDCIEARRLRVFWTRLADDRSATLAALAEYDAAVQRREARWAENARGITEENQTSEASPVPPK